RERRKLRDAAHSRDGQRFAAAAVNAMRVACAPHFPAEPRALVGSDVLQLLHETNGGDRPEELVRRFFNVADASRFAGGSADARGPGVSEIGGIEAGDRNIAESWKFRVAARPARSGNSGLGTSGLAGSVQLGGQE